MLDDVVTWYEVKKFGAELFGKSTEKVKFSIYVSGIADDAAESDSACSCISLDTLGDIVGSVQGHHLTTGYDVDLFCLTFTDRHCETTADNVTENIVENIIQIISIGA